MTGIRELFAELSQPDFYDVSAQLELWCWQRRKALREYQARYAEKVKSDNAKLEARRAYQRAWKAARYVPVKRKRHRPARPQAREPRWKQAFREALEQRAA